MPSWKAVAVDLMNRVRTASRAAEDQTRASGPMSEIPSRWGILVGLFAEQWRIACTIVSRASSQLAQVVGAESSQEGWAPR